MEIVKDEIKTDNNQKVKILAPPSSLELSIKDTGLLMIEQFAKIIESSNELFKKQNYPVRIDYSWSEVTSEGKRFLIGDLNIIREGKVLNLLRFNSEIKVDEVLKGNYYYSFIFTLLRELLLKGINLMELELEQRNEYNSINVNLKELNEEQLNSYIALMADKFNTEPFTAKEATKTDLFNHALKVKQFILNGANNG